ncbi:PREDICTED: NADH dehydrogenase [ubiquinone] 1 beta subcomplex subunit 11, mitochondrial-like, partial [Rhagoletis zephyria]|uniref:NADH dehydrogenase [ubiquinone] 1 beta subcomplex subunit 11, mitochondrial-like n=1 Tax=Rhagoletis zephyria TaxID=28612 RepID=UPI000811989C
MNVRCINTTKKNKDHHTIDIYDPDYVDTKKPEGPKTAKEFADVKSQKNWISYGFDFIDPANDRSLMNFTFFTMITMGFVVFTYIIYYFPDFVLHDWAIREGFLELDRRERLGLPLIDRNLVDPATLDLPTDEELGDYKVYT